MLSYKNYIKILFSLLFVLLTTVYIYTYWYAKNYPIPLVHSISVDAKFQFIRDHIDRDKIDTLIVGSSIGLNNVQGVVLEQKSSRVKHALNLSGFGLNTMQIEQLLELRTLFPNLKRVIYSAQFPDFSLPTVFDNYNVDFIKEYIKLGEHNIDLKYALFAFKNFITVNKHHREWEKEYLKDGKFEFLNFDHTGSVPLNIYGDNIIKDRWENPHRNHPINESYQSLWRMVKKVKKEGLHFYFIIQPYRATLLKKYKDVNDTLTSFDQNSSKIILANHGEILNLHRQLALTDDYFADRSHLNDKGSKKSAEAIAVFIDRCEGIQK
jgi:hypothetical protein